MKTLIKKLKLGILLTGLIMLASCDSNSALLSAAGTNAIHRTIPSLAINATKFTGNKIAQYFKHSSVSKKENSLSGKRIEKPNRSLKAMPISIGVTEGARLVSTPGR
jgi:hypothetical protein